MIQNLLVKNPDGSIRGRCLLSPEDVAMISVYDRVGKNDSYREIFRQCRPNGRFNTILRVVTMCLKAGMSISSIGKLIADLNKHRICDHCKSIYGVDSIMDLSGNELDKAMCDIVGSCVRSQTDERQCRKFPSIMDGEYKCNHQNQYPNAILSNMVKFIEYEIEQGRSYQQIGDSLQQLHTNRVRYAIGCDSIFEISDEERIREIEESSTNSRYKSHLKRYRVFMEARR